MTFSIVKLVSGQVSHTLRRCLNFQYTWSIHNLYTEDFGGV